jgi:hypothetical protein
MKSSHRNLLFPVCHSLVFHHVPKPKTKRGKKISKTNNLITDDRVTLQGGSESGVLEAVQIADPVHGLAHDGHLGQLLRGAPRRRGRQRLTAGRTR